MVELVNRPSVAAALLVLGVAGAPCVAGAQEVGGEPADTLARLRGVLVLEAEGLPLVGAFLHLEGTAFATRSDSLGRFDLGVVPPGAHRVTLHHPLWQARRMEPPTAVLSVVAGEATELEWLLPSPDQRGTELDPIPLEGITAVVDAELERERVSGSSRRFIGSAEIAELRGRGMTVADLVRDRIASLRTIPARRGFGMECVQARRMGEDGLQVLYQYVNPAPDCPEQVPVIVDGVKILDPSTYLPTLSLEVVESVEFVPGVVAGSRYGTGFAAGVLVIETRVR